MSLRTPRRWLQKLVSPRTVEKNRPRKLLALLITALIALPASATALIALPAAAAPAAPAATTDWNTTKYGQTFYYRGSGHWTIVNTDGSKAIKNLAGPSGTRPELCTDYDTGLGLPCTNGASYDFTSTATFEGQSCAYVQIDGGGHGSQDTVPGDAGKRVCAPEPPVDQCLVVTENRYSKTVSNSHQEYRFPKETRSAIPHSHEEWRFQTRTPLYGEIEHKAVKGWRFVDGGHVTVNGQTVTGHWEEGSSGTYYDIPGSVINAVWGPSGVPDSVLGTGTVSLSTYGGPNRTVQYNAYKETTTEGFTPWGPWGDWSTTDPGPATETRNTESRTVADPDTYTDWASAGYTDWSTSSAKPADTLLIRYGAVESKSVSDPSSTVYYLPGGGTSTTLTDANWTTDTPSAPWTKVDTRSLPTDASCVPPPPSWVCESGAGHWSYTNGTWYAYTITENLDGSSTITVAPSAGYAFAPGTTTSWTDSNVSCPLPKDATASVGTTPPTCDTDGSAYVTGLVHATLQGTLNIGVGSHTATFKAAAGHLFGNGTDTLQVPYTVLGAVGNCLDASAEVKVDPPACGVNGSASLGTLTFATLQGTLDINPGSYTATFKAADGHLFGNGTDTLQVPYSVLGALLYQYTDPDGDCYIEPPHKDDTVDVQEGTWVCGDTVVNVTTTTTTYTFDFDAKTGTFSAPIPHIGTPVFTKRALTNTEIGTCPLTGDVQAVCKAETSYLSWSLALPTGFQPTGGDPTKPVSITVTGQTSHQTKALGTFPLQGSTPWPMGNEVILAHFSVNPKYDVLVNPVDCSKALAYTGSNGQERLSVFVALGAMALGLLLVALAMYLRRGRKA